MSRRNRHKPVLDFDIHVDRDSINSLMDEGTDTRDFAKDSTNGDDGGTSCRSTAEFEKDNETLLDTDVEYDKDSRVHTEATESNMTRTSTLVDGESEHPDESQKKSLESESEPADDQRSEISLAKAVDIPDSFGATESEVSTATEDQTNDASTIEGSTGAESELATADESLIEQEDEYTTQASDSRRESGMSDASQGSRRRGSGRTEALIQAAARDIVAQINLDQGRESYGSQSMTDDQSYISRSGLSSARPSDVHESVADESYVSHEDGHDDEQSVTEDNSFVSDSKHSSARPSLDGSAVDAHEPQSKHSSARPSLDGSVANDDTSCVSQSKQSSARLSMTGSVVDKASPSSRSKHSSARPSLNESLAGDHSSNSRSHHSSARTSLVKSVEEDFSATAHPDEGADSSSHNENDDDVFSDHSPRSSLGSLSEADQRKLQDSVTRRTRSPRVSDFSHYDYREDEEFVPTVRGTPRPAFRSPSSVKAIQMSSPPASILGSPRSSRRTPLPTVSRLGSPSVSAQYSPKKTPPRFKRNTPPLVLLHATLLPLRWPWAEVLENAQLDELSPETKTLREAWRHLQDRLGDTVLERGILLPHPQNDFEVLEERLLEALELPLRRRARILECGHYLGPSNEMTILEESDSEQEEYDDFDKRQSSRSMVAKQTHWCGTCRGEIKYDSLGPGKIFRVKVYASNGLMKAGAWEACWKEMERVDVELEPMVEAAAQDELSRLAAEQESALELSAPQDGVLEEEEEQEEELAEEPNASFLEQDPTGEQTLPSSPPVNVRSPPSRGAVDEDRRRRDEERLREIYGEEPPMTHTEPAAASVPPSSEYVHRETPPSPSAEAYARREERRQQAGSSESLPDLLMQALRVAMQDRKNVMIALLSVLVLAFAMRGGGSSSSSSSSSSNIADPGLDTPVMQQPLVKSQDMKPLTVTVTETPAAQETVESLLASTLDEVTSSVVASVKSEAASEDPCATASVGAQVQAPPQQQQVEQQTVRIVETVTETAIEKATVIETQTETLTQTFTATAYVTDSVDDVSLDKSPAEVRGEELEHLEEEQHEESELLLGQDL